MNDKLNEQILEACKNVFVEEASDEGQISGLILVDALVHALVAIIDTAPNKQTKDEYAIYASSLAVTKLRDRARQRGEDDTLPDQVDEDRMETAQRIVEAIREKEGVEVALPKNTIH